MSPDDHYSFQVYLNQTQASSFKRNFFFIHFSMERVTKFRVNMNKRIPKK
jgi:hypothetical protein